MKKLEIIEVNNYLYKLKDTNNNIYNFTFEFHSINPNPTIGDTIYMSDELLKKDYIEYSNFYAFGALNDTSGRNVEDEENIQDIIMIESKGGKEDVKKKYLKRLYG